MTNEEKTLLAGLTVTAIGAPVIIGLVLRWPIWLWVLLIVVLLLVPFQARRTILFRSHQRELRQQAFPQPPAPRAELEPAPTPPPQFQREILASVPLDSGADDYDFLFAATVYWRTVPRPGGWQHANPAALATQAIITRAREVTIQEPPHRCAMAQVRLESALGTVLGDDSGFVEAWAAQVRLTLTEADLARLRRLADVRKEQDVWEHERQHERDRRAYLTDDVLKNTGSAVVWWLAHANEDVRSTVSLIDTLRRLTAAANNTEVPELDRTPGTVPIPPAPEVSVTDRVRGLMDALDLDEPGRALFVRRLAKLLAGAGRQDAADDILAAFEPPPETGPTSEPAQVFADLPPEPDWTEPPPNGIADAVPEWVDEPDRSPRSDPSGVDSQ